MVMVRKQGDTYPPLLLQCDGHAADLTKAKVTATYTNRRKRTVTVPLKILKHRNGTVSTQRLGSVPPGWVEIAIHWPNGLVEACHPELLVEEPYP